MNSATFPGGASIVNLLPIAEISATTTGAGVDIQPYKGHGLVLLDVSAPTAGGAPTNAVKLQTSPEAKKVTSVTYAGTGNGKMEVEAGPDPVAEDITFTASSATEFAVVGSVSGALGTLTVGTWFKCAQIKALILAGATAFVQNDLFTVPTTARSWTDAGDFAAQTTAAHREKKSVDLDKCPRYLRAVSTLGGAGTKYVISANLLAIAQ